MTRLQKKCLVAAAGMHLLVVVAVLCSGFILSKPKADDTQVLDMIPANVLENVMNQGVKGAQLPPPTPKPPEPAPPTPEPPTPVDPPKPEPKPQPKPEPKPEPKPVAEVKPADKPDIAIPKPKPEKHEIKVNLDTVTRDSKKVAEDKAAAAKAQREAQRKAEAFRRAVNNISEKASSATEVEMPGEGSVSYANYASVVRSVYEHAWIAPDNADNDDAIVKVSVTIARDGHVVTSRVLNPSGDAKVDGSVQRTLDRVRFVREFPDGAKESEKTFIINFNLKAKRMLL